MHRTLPLNGGKGEKQLEKKKFQKDQRNNEGGLNRETLQRARLLFQGEEDHRRQGMRMMILFIFDFLYNTKENITYHMFSLTNAQKILEINTPIYSPIEIDDTLLVCSYNGEIIKYSEGQLKLLTKVNGQIRSIVHDPIKGTYYVTDLLAQSVIAINANDFSQTQLVNEYEGTPLEGPNSLIISNKTGNIFFTDSGYFGQNHIPNSKGSLFVIDMQQQCIRPLLLRCLAGPYGLAFSHDEKVIYVAETGKNRILRVYESSEGVYYTSVFHQFNGRFGPTAIAVTNEGYILVALFEFNTITEHGCIAVLNQEGQLREKLKLPECGPQISGMFLARQTGEDIMLLVTENSVKQSCHRLMIKIDKENDLQK